MRARRRSLSPTPAASAVGPITTVVEQGTASPPVFRPMAMAAKAADSTPVEAGTQDVTADVTVSFTIR